MHFFGPGRLRLKQSMIWRKHFGLQRAEIFRALRPRPAVLWVSSFIRSGSGHAVLWGRSQ